MNYESLREIISLAETWEQESNAQGQWDEQAFTAWLLARNASAKQRELADENVTERDGHLSMLMAFMYKYASYYSRRVTRGSPVYSLDDFGVLASLFPDRKLSKIEAIRLNLMEKSSGTEVLRRMLRSGLLEESDNPSDRRSRLIGLSEAGRAAFMGIIGPIRKMSTVIMADLEEEEKLMLMHILHKLERYHRPVFDNHSEEELAELLGLV